MYKRQDVLDTVKPIIEKIFHQYGGGKKVYKEWPLISYEDSILWYGSDKPDLRNPIKMQIVSDIFRDSGFAVFSNILKNKGTEIKAIPAPGGGSRNFCDRMNSFAQKEGLPGMGYIFWREIDGKIDAAGPLAKNIGEEKSELIRQRLNLNIGDSAFFLEENPLILKDFLQELEIILGMSLNL